MKGVFTAQVVRLEVEIDLASFGTVDGFMYKEFLMLLTYLGRGSCSEIGAWSLHCGLLKPDLSFGQVGC